MICILTCTSLVAIIAFSPLDKGVYTYKLNTFQSYDDLLAFLHKRFETYGNQGRYYYYVPNVVFRGSVLLDTANAASEGRSVLPDYSTTNVQVAGVDEPDIVKTDGTYLYVIAGQTLYIIKAYPVREATILSRITIVNVAISNIFIRDDRLVIFGDSYTTYSDPLYDGTTERQSAPEYWWGGTSTAVTSIYDVTDRANPILTKEVKIDGSFFNARLIDDYIYLVATEDTNAIYRTYDGQNYTLVVPKLCIDEEQQNISPDNIYYVDVPELSDTMTHLVSINLDTNDVVEKSFMLGSSQTMYVSKNNIFLASVHYPYIPLLGADGSVLSTTKEKTILHKISINTGEITYIAQGEVPGRILNQFSMDEHEGFFRIATTIGNVWDQETKSTNNIYILDGELKQVSALENIAPGEQIHSARFIGAKAYLVTFKKIDPFFTIDLSNPYNPKILGELKIPGYSDYLHPFDENHIIGVGKDADDQGRFAWYQGLKIALFDVSDFQNPIEIASIIIGDRGTDSPVLYDHKAFLFDPEKELLVLPVSLYTIFQEEKDAHPEGTGSIYGQYTFQGAYVYHLSLENGFELKGRITHQTQEQQTSNSEYWYWGAYNTDITRTLYIGDTLYTISDSMVKMNNLDDLNELKSIRLT